MSVEPDLHLHQGPWTEQEYLALPDDRRRVELLDGALLMSPSASFRHQRLSSWLWLALESAGPADLEVLAAINVRVGPDRILIPDLAVVTKPGEDITVIDAEDVLMVVEIVSPGSVATDRAIKPRLYAEAGIPHYLRIELASSGPVAVLHRLRGGQYVAGEAGSVLRLERPFPVEVDLAALLAAKRPPRT